MTDNDPGPISTAPDLDGKAGLAGSTGSPSDTDRQAEIGPGSAEPHPVETDDPSLDSVEVSSDGDDVAAREGSST